MVAPRYDLAILVLTEDRSDDAHYVIAALAKKMLRLVDEACQTHRIRFDPPNEAARSVVVANRWKDRRRRERVDLLQLIATTLLLRLPEGFVFLHFDGDQKWSRRSDCEHMTPYVELIVKPVEELVRSHSSEPVEAVMVRLRLLVPFYSIESWLYQNTRVAARICREQHWPDEERRFDEWAACRAAIDEVHRPKDSVRLGSRYNLDLATEAFPAGDALGAGASFFCAAFGLSECEPLRAALARSAT